MTEHAYEDPDDILPPEPNGELVHWMSAKPMSVGGTGLAAAVAAAFVLGVGAALAALALTRRRDAGARPAKRWSRRKLKAAGWEF